MRKLKYRKHILSKLGLTTVLLSSSLLLGNTQAQAAYGDCCTPYWDEVIPYIGVDYYQVWMHTKGDWNQLFGKTYPGGVIYVGAKFCDSFGVEFGGMWSARTGKTSPLGTFFGTPAIPGMLVTTTITRAGGYGDFIGYVPMGNCFEVFGSAGYGVIQPKVTFSTNVTVNNNTPLNSALLSVRGKSRGVFRLGIGMTYLLTEMLGIRAKLGWEGTSQLRFDGNQFFYNLGFSTRGFKGSTTLQGGFFLKF